MPAAIDLDDAVLAAIRDHGEDRVSRSLARLTRKSYSRLWRSAYPRSADRLPALSRFLVSNPAVLEAALVAQTARVDRDHGQDQALGWLLNLMSGFQLASEHVTDDRLVIVDEGFCQRSVALFGLGFTDADHPLLTRYLSSIPLPETLIVVETPLEICESRLDQRGWSERVDGLGPEDRRRFLQRANDVVSRVVQHVGSTTSRVIWVDGTTPTPDSVVTMAATLAP